MAPHDENAKRFHLISDLPLNAMSFCASTPAVEVCGGSGKMNEIESGKPRVYVNAMFCESVIRDKKNNLSAIRITDGFIINPLKIIPTLPDGSPDEEHAQFVYQPLRIGAIFTFRSEEPTEFTATLRGVRPNGKPFSSSVESLVVRIGKGAEGHTKNVNFTITTEEEGDYWIEFYVDGVLANKVPIRIIHGSDAIPVQLSAKLGSDQSEPSKASE